jgi:hypothetical protein
MKQEKEYKRVYVEYMNPNQYWDQFKREPDEKKLLWH